MMSDPFVAQDGTTVDHHRNGVSGEPFYVCHFDDPEEGRMMSIVFPPDDPEPPLAGRPFHNPRVAVLKESVLPDTRFFFNSWRGDHFAERCYRAIDEWYADLRAQYSPSGKEKT